MKTLIVIPARGGSKRIPRKNVRIMCGKPLISYSIENAKALREELNFDVDVAVSTDDEELGSIVEKRGVDVIARPAELATDNVTLDPVIYHALCRMEEKKGCRYDTVITMQATSPTLKMTTIRDAILYFEEHEYDTVLSATNKPHLSWGVNPEGEFVKNYEKRLNSQQLPPNYLETGGFLITRRECVSETGRIGEKVSIFEIPEDEAVDIDTYSDWVLCENILRRKKIMFRTVGKRSVGMGHVYRCLTLAYKLTGHDVVFAASADSDIGIEKIAESNFRVIRIEDEDHFERVLMEEAPDILVNDILDTTSEYMKMATRHVKRIVNFEDVGSGAKYADAVINALYEKGEKLHNEYYGSRYFCIRDEFLEEHPKEFSEKAENVLVIFGGADPSDLTGRLYDICRRLHPEHPDVKFHFLLGFAYPYAATIITSEEDNVFVHKDVKRVSAYMSRMDLAITSQGRTVYELASMGVPAIVLAQNEREARHVFAGIQNGFINLGIGSETDDETIISTIGWLLSTPNVRREMRKLQLQKDFSRGHERVIKLILDDNDDDDEKTDS
ncbi:MAG: UDP-2,4-diacetamido-2,4,6-trideoxy-beta-L-altropyranose hydrolase [Lachnospiraceae bacterium]|nr:UDP-2,4-diacetamido-2,4,6-trideoxy-beta-L-altropyranose hydrolase [Lachnospiraceae bacterium]